MAKPWKPKFTFKKYALRKVGKRGPTYRKTGFVSRARATTRKPGRYGGYRGKQKYSRSTHRGRKYGAGKNVRVKDLGVAKYNVTNNFAASPSAKSACAYFIVKANADPVDLAAMVSAYNSAFSSVTSNIFTNKFQIVRDKFICTFVAGPITLAQAGFATAATMPLSGGSGSTALIGTNISKTFVRVYLFQAREDIPVGSGNDYTSIQAAWGNLYVKQAGSNSADLTEVDFNPFENTPWLEKFKCIKSWKFQLGGTKTTKTITHYSKPYRHNGETDLQGDFLMYGGRSTCMLVYYQGAIGLSDGKGSGGSSTLGLPEVGQSGSLGILYRTEIGYNALPYATDLNTEVDNTVKLRTGDTALYTVPANYFAPQN